MPPDGLSILSDVRGPTLAIDCKQCGQRGCLILKLIVRPGRCSDPSTESVALCAT
jgi:hypothetical protein